MFKITATTASFATLKRLPASATAVVRSYAASAQPPPGEQAKKEAMKDTEDLKWPRASKTDIVDQKLAERLAQEPPELVLDLITGDEKDLDLRFLCPA